MGSTGGAGPAGTPNVAERRAELTDAHRRAAAQVANGDVIGGLVGTMAPDGIYVAALRELGKGTAAARTFLARDTLIGRSRAVWTVVRLDVSADGRDGYSYGYFDMIRANGDTVPGAYQAYWRRNENGEWRTLALRRSRRASGPTNTLPDAWRASTTVYRSWPMRDTTEGWATLKATEVAFSDSSVTSIRAAFMSFAAPDAAKVQGSQYGFGREAIGEEFRTPSPGFTGIEWHAEWGSVSGSNDLGFNIGPVSQRNPPAGAPQGPGGLFFTVWRRQPNGEWKYLVD
jgi:ketosteroid isomerase-like protein